MKIDIRGIRLNLNIFKNILSLLYFALTKKIYFGPFSALENFEINNYKVNLRPNEVLIKTLYGGYCGSDKKIITYDYSFLSSAFLTNKKINDQYLYMGHEVIGELIKVGEKVKNFKAGDKITIDSMNRDYEIKNNKFGGWTNFMIRNEKQILRVNPKKLDKSIFLEPLACALQPVKSTDHKNKKVLIIGLGTMGMCLASIIRYFYNKKVKIYGISNNYNDKKKIKKNIFNKFVISNDLLQGSSKLINVKINSKIGNRQLADGFDIVYDCSGSKKIFNNLLRVAGKKAKIFLMSMNMNFLNFDPSPIWMNEQNIIGIYGYDFKFKKENTLKYTQKLLYNKNFTIKNLTIENFSFKDWKNFVQKQNTKSIKKVIYF